MGKIHVDITSLVSVLTILKQVYFCYRKWRRTSIFILVFLIVFCLEFLVYFLQAWTWQKLHCPANSKCTRFLFVADPQILGELDEPNPITIWDNDR